MHRYMREVQIGVQGKFGIFAPIAIKLAKINKNYTQASENKLSSTRTWSVNNIMCSQKSFVAL